MLSRGRKRLVAALALAAVLALPAASAQAADRGTPGGGPPTWASLWQWITEVLTPGPGGQDGVESEHGSYIDPNG